MFNQELADRLKAQPEIGPEDFYPESEDGDEGELGFSGEEPGVDEELYPGGPLISQVMAWKATFGEGTVFMTEVAGELFIWRTMNRFEYKAIVTRLNSDPLQREEMMCEACVLWHPDSPMPYSYEVQAQTKAGIPARLAELIMEKSGFDRNVKTRAL
jgi:hypothetical protein